VKLSDTMAVFLPTMLKAVGVVSVRRKLLLTFASSIVIILQLETHGIVTDHLGFLLGAYHWLSN